MAENERLRRDNRRASAAVVFVAVVVLAVASFVAFAGTAAAQEAVDECTVIDEAGEYELTEDISSTETCIEITSSDVNFDGNGFNVTGLNDPEGEAGIFANGTASTDAEIENVTVENVTVQDWDPGLGTVSQGVRYGNVTEGTVRGVTALGNTIGVDVRESTDVLVTENDLFAPDSGATGVQVIESSVVEVDDNEVVNLGVGVELEQTTDIRVTDNVLDSETGVNDGFFFGGSENLTVIDNRIEKPDEDLFLFEGMQLFGTSNSTIKGNNILESQGNGILLSDGGDSAIRNNTVTESSSSGIRIDSSSNNTVRENTVEDGGFIGINIFPDADDNLVVDNEVHGHTGNEGILSQNSANNTIRDNVATDNNWNIGVLNSVDDLVYSNTVRDAGSEGIYLFSGTENTTVEANTVLDSPVGINVESNTEANDIVDNTVLRSNDVAIELIDDTDSMVTNLDIGASTAENTTLSFGGNNVRVNVTTDPAAPPADLEAVGRYFDAELLSSLDAASVNAEGKGAETDGSDAQSNEAESTVEPVQSADGLTDLELSYEDDDVAGVDETTLSLWRFNETAGEWQEIDASGVDTTRQVVTADVEEFSTFGAFGEEEPEEPVEECVDRRNLSRGEEDEECPNDRDLRRGETREDLDERTDRSGRGEHRDSATERRSRSR